MAEIIEIFTAGAVCPECSRVGKVIDTELTKPGGQPHPSPYRRFECACGNRWNAPIPQDQYRIIPANPQKPGKCRNRLSDAATNQK